MTADTLAAYRVASHEMAEAIAPTWERRRAEVEEVAAPVREWLLEAAAPGRGETVLELAAGVGETGFEAARLVAPTGRLITSDFSPAMLDAARRRGAELGVDRVEYRIIDAEQIELAAGSVDVVLCRFGYMLVGDPARAFAETRRVLRPGGRLALAVWGRPQQNPCFAVIGGILVEHGHVEPPPPPPAPGIFALGSPERTEGLLRGAGFAEVRIEEVPVRFVLPDVREYLALIADTGGPVGLVLRRLDRADRTEVESAAGRALAPFASERGYELPGVALCALAR